MAAAPDVSQSAAAQWTCLPLAKFSYATSLSEHDAYINWVHLPQRDNLFVVFDTIRIRLSGNRYEERKVLKVVCGSDILVILLTRRGTWVPYLHLFVEINFDAGAP